MSPPPADDGQSAAVVLGPEPSESEPSESELSESESEPSESVGLPNELEGEQGVEDDCTKETGLTHKSTASSISQSKGPNIESNSVIDLVKVESGIDLAPMDNLVSMVNDNLSNCRSCKGSSLELVTLRRVGFAANWRISCTSCDKVDMLHRNSMNHLKRQLPKCKDHKGMRALKRKITKKKEKSKTETIRRGCGTSPHLW